jgi:hypothetical protein
MGKKDFKNIISNSMNSDNILDEVLGIKAKVLDSQNNNNHDSAVAAVAPKIKKAKSVEAPIKQPIVKMSFNLEGDLHERLRSYVFQTRNNKTAVIHNALDKLLKGKGY